MKKLVGNSNASLGISSTPTPSAAQMRGLQNYFGVYSSVQMEEFATLNRDKPLEKDLKSDEQLKRHSVDAHLEAKPVERALHLLTIGEEVQRLSVIQNLTQLLEGNELQCMQRVIPRVQLALPNASTEFHIAASSTFKNILEKKLLPPKTFTQTFLQSILSSLESRDPVVANAWLETLLDVIDLLPNEVVKTDILPIAVNKGQISQKLATRITACKLLGKISTHVDVQTLKKDTLPIILSLCQDVKAEVRACICSQLPFVAQVLGAEGVKPSILPLLVELSSDEEASVRLSSVEAIVCMLPNLTQDTLKNTIVPLVRKTCESSLSKEDNVMVVLAQVFGELCLGLEGALSPQEKRWLLNYYQQLAELGLRPSDRDYGGRKNMPDLVPMSNNTDKFVECRHHCAFHFPAMTRFCTSTTDNFDEHLYPVFSGLACDPYFAVRRTIACGLHEVTRVLGNNNGIVKSELVKLLRDDSEEVLSGLIPNLSKTLILLAKSGTINPDFMDTSTLEVGRALLKCETEVSVTNNWRLHEMLIQQLECLHLVLPSDFIHSYFTPMLFTRIHRARQVPVRLAATNTLLVYLRYNTKNLQKNDIRSRIISELCNGHSCYSRFSFMRLCSQALDVFSRKYFKEHFYLSVLERAEDRVANIRLMFVKLLPRLKLCLRMPSDKKYFAALEASIRKLISVEKDKDVTTSLEKTLAALDKIECTLDTAHVTSHSSKEDQDDNRKQEEENRLANATGKLADNKQGLSPQVVPSAPMTAAARQNVALANKPQMTRYGVPASSASTAGITGAMNQRGLASPAASRNNLLNQRGDPSPMSSNRTVPTPAGSRPTPGTYPDSSLSRPNNTTLHPSNSAAANKDKDAYNSLEDEFYRDAGIRIPEQFTSSVRPSRIPSARETLFKNQHTSGYSSDEGFENREKQNVIGTNLKKEYDKADSKVTHGSTASQKVYNTKLTMPKKSSPVNTQREEAEKSSANSPKSAAKSAGLITNRRHSYLAGEKMLKTNLRIEEKEVPRKRVTAVVDNSRRHSYIERLQISTQDCESSNDARYSMNQSKRQSLHGKEEQSYRSPLSQVTKPTIPLRKNLNRTSQNAEPKPDVANRRRSLNFTQTERPQTGSSTGINRADGLQTERMQRGSSVGPNRADYSENMVKRRSLIAPVTMSKLGPNRRHSSLERDDMERDVPRYSGSRSQGLSYATRRSQSPRMSKEDLRTGAKQSPFSSDDSLYKTKLQRPGFVLKNEAADADFAARLSKIPRSNNSSPGGSRSSSPSSVPRHLTAPNSRAASPTGVNKRLSLGTLNSYMTNMKLTEPSSKLPVRKK